MSNGATLRRLAENVPDQVTHEGTVGANYREGKPVVTRVIVNGVPRKSYLPADPGRRERLLEKLRLANGYR